MTTGRWDEVAPYVEFMGYTEPWYSVRDVSGLIGDDMGSITSFLRDGSRVFLTYATTGRGNEPVNGSMGLLDMTPYGRGEAWRTSPRAGPRAAVLLVLAGGLRRRRDLGADGRPTPQWSRPGATPAETLGRGEEPR